MVEGLGLDVITTELSLGLPDASHARTTTRAEKKRVFLDMIIDENMDSKLEQKSGGGGGVSKTQVVGWPPVCSYRKRNNILDSNNYVKVSMDGTVYLRKIDLSMQKGYSDLALALESLFVCHGIGKALKDEDCSEYKLIYEDKDGDWMLVGDVPWECRNGASVKLPRLHDISKDNHVKRGATLIIIFQNLMTVWSKMFVGSCKRLRIMKRFEEGRNDIESLQTIDFLKRRDSSKDES